MLGMYGMLGALRNFIALDVAESDMDCLLCGRLWSNRAVLSTLFI